MTKSEPLGSPDSVRSACGVWIMFFFFFSVLLFSLARITCVCNAGRRHITEPQRWRVCGADMGSGEDRLEWQPSTALCTALTARGMHTVCVNWRLEDVSVAYRSAVWVQIGFRLSYDDSGKKVLDKTVCKHCVCLCCI